MNPDKINITDSQYYNLLAAAYVRGLFMRTKNCSLPKELLEKSLGNLSDTEIEMILQSGKEANAKLYAFKNTHTDMPRVKRVTGFLKSIGFESLLDVGSGRGVFLFPFMEEFPWVRVSSIDVLPHRVEFLQDITNGGIDRLNVFEGDICAQPFADNSFDVVTMLEVLEHIPDVEKAILSAVKIARKHIVVTVPSKPDNNPDHIHLLTKDVLTDLFGRAGCTRLRFDGVTGHLFMVATVM